MESLIKYHERILGVKPYIIGIFWDDDKKLNDNIIKAIEDNKPYNEYELLTKKEQKDFNEGNLLF